MSWCLSAGAGDRKTRLVWEALAQDGPHAVGNQVGETRWRELLGEAGFSQVRLAAATPFNIVLEARR
jgi:hypothetical protein